MPISKVWRGGKRARWLRSSRELCLVLSWAQKVCCRCEDCDSTRWRGVDVVGQAQRLSTAKAGAGDGFAEAGGWERKAVSRWPWLCCAKNAQMEEVLRRAGLTGG